MRNAFKREICVYCFNVPAETKDHVICRGFFPPNKRGNLPQVPACKTCNNEKSVLESYLTAIMPFGAQHQNSAIDTALTGRRLAKNKKLHVELTEGKAAVTASDQFPAGMTLPLRENAMEKLCCFIVKGLAWHHWKLELGPNHFVGASFFDKVGSPIFDAYITRVARDRVKDNLGEGVFVYEGVRSTECSELTMWRMTLSGVCFLGDQRSPMEPCKMVYGCTGRTSDTFASELIGVFNQ